MPNLTKYDKILNALQTLLENKEMKTISVSEIAQAAGIGKGSIYYYFPSKEAIWEALVARNYEKPLETAKNLAQQTDISPFTRMAMIFQACRSSSSAFLKQRQSAGQRSDQDQAFLHQKYISHLISELKPEVTAIIEQAAKEGTLHCTSPSALAEIVLIVLTVKLDNTLVPSSETEIEETIQELVKLLERGTQNPEGSLNFLTAL